MRGGPAEILRVTRRRWLSAIGRGGKIRTRDPVRPRRFSSFEKLGLFSTLCISSTYGMRGEMCGAQLNVGALDSYKIIYIENHELG
jgi:hypothetical protein